MERKRVSLRTWQVSYLQHNIPNTASAKPLKCDVWPQTCARQSEHPAVASSNVLVQARSKGTTVHGAHGLHLAPDPAAPPSSAGLIYTLQRPHTCRT